ADRLSDVNGAVTDSYLYKAFGAIAASSGATVNPFRFVGREGYYLDGDLGTYWLRARIYDPGTGRFTSRDPLSFAAGDANLYCYVGNNPVILTDPSGRAAPPPRKPKLTLEDGPNVYLCDGFEYWVNMYTGYNNPSYSIVQYFCI